MPSHTEMYLGPFRPKARRTPGAVTLPQDPCPLAWPAQVHPMAQWPCPLSQRCFEAAIAHAAWNKCIARTAHHRLLCVLPFRMMWFPVCPCPFAKGGGAQAVPKGAQVMVAPHGALCSREAQALEGRRMVTSVRVSIQFQSNPVPGPAPCGVQVGGGGGISHHVKFTVVNVAFLYSHVPGESEPTSIYPAV